ncbi:MAG: hypothetical protein WDN06_15060 [Asticcacaulis sp.]
MTRASFFQRYDFLGDKVGSEVRAGDDHAGYFSGLSVVPLAGDGFALSWAWDHASGPTDVFQKVFYTQTPVDGDSNSNSLTGVGIEADMRGHGGDDTYIVDSYSDSAYEKPNEGTDLVMSSVDFQLADNIEKPDSDGDVEHRRCGQCSGQRSERQRCGQYPVGS